MFQFIKSTLDYDQIKNCTLKKIFILGRSNVGKSSFINSLTNNTKLSHTSKTPGKTQTLNFFSNQKTIIIDSPGYGFAKSTNTTREKWGKIIDYALSNLQISYLLLLIDARRGVMPMDLELLDMLQQYDIEILIVSTKNDKKNIIDLNIYPELQNYKIFKISNKTKLNIDKLKKYLKI